MVDFTSNDLIWQTGLLLRNFLEQGGQVLLVIMAVTFLLFWLVLDRLHYLWIGSRRHHQQLLAQWGARHDKQSWYAQQIRVALLSMARVAGERHFGTIRAVVVIAPLLGLLGTVTGMVSVFDVMAVTGSSNSRAMAAGVSRATIPTMAGMVVSLLGLLFNLFLSRRAKVASDMLAEKMELESGQ